MDPITIALGLAQLVPSIASWFGASQNSVQTAQKVVDIAKQVTGASDGDSALEAVKNNPQYAIQLEQEIDRNKEALANIGQAVPLALIQADNQTIQAVNQTMQAEDKSDHWPTYSWRPFIGFIFGLMVFGDYFIIPILNGWWKIPQPAIPSEAWVAIGGILGVASYFRGKMQSDPTVSSDNRG